MACAEIPFCLVEAIGRTSNLGDLCKKWADLRKRFNESPARPPLSREDSGQSRFKRFLTAHDVADIVDRYEVGETTQQIGNRYGISKTRVATVLRERDMTIRRQGLTEKQTAEVVNLYAAGESLARLGVRFGVSHTTIAVGTSTKRYPAAAAPRMELAHRSAAVPPLRGSPVGYWVTVFGGCSPPEYSTTDAGRYEGVSSIDGHPRE
jgi:uncharacterized protein (DUF433 family)